MQCKYNSFNKKPNNKTAFILANGDPIFSETVYLLQPFYVKKRTPDFTLVCKGKHVTGLFKVSENTFLGDFQKKALFVFLRAEGLAMDLFQTDLNPGTAKGLLLDGKLNEAFSQARNQVS